MLYKWVITSAIFSWLMQFYTEKRKYFKNVALNLQVRYAQPSWFSIEAKYRHLDLVQNLQVRPIILLHVQKFCRI